MWPFKTQIPFIKDDITVYKHRLVDWDKVKTVDDLIALVRALNMFKQIFVSEERWDDPGIAKLLDDKTITRTYINGRLEKEEIK